MTWILLYYLFSLSGIYFIKNLLFFFYYKFLSKNYRCLDIFAEDKWSLGISEGILVALLKNNMYKLRDTFYKKRNKSSSHFEFHVYNTFEILKETGTYFDYKYDFYLR